MAMKSASLIVLIAVLYGLHQRWTRVPVPGANGSCTEAFREVEMAYRAGYERGTDIGSAFAIYHKGQLVCDLWGGWADEINQIPWSADTISLVYSTTKGVSALTLAVLHDRGLFEYEEMVAKYWPEFANNGKEKVTIAQLASHQAGLAVLDEKLTLQDIRENPDKVSRVIENQKPNWEPGKEHGYHALTFGLLIDQLIRRIDPEHRGLHEFFNEEIAIPYGVDFHIGLPHAEQWRSARLVYPTGLYGLKQQLTNPFMIKFMLGADDMLKKAFENPEIPYDGINWPSTKATPFGSIMGSGSARAIAKLYSMAADLSSQQRLFSEDTLRIVTTPQTGTRVEKLIGITAPFGMGVVLHKHKEGGLEFGHQGYGGQVGSGIPDYNVGFSYITNYIDSYINSYDDPRVGPLHQAMLRCLRKLHS